MDTGPSLFLLFALEIGLFAVAALGLWFGLRALRRRVLQGSGGWAALEAAFGVDAAPEAPIATGASLMVGPVLWRNCVAVGADPSGLHLAVRVPLLGGMGKRPVVIPWDAFRDPEPATLYWGTARLWHLGEPEVATLTLPSDLDARLDIAARRRGVV